MSTPAAGFSFVRVLALLIPVAIVAAVVGARIPGYETAAQAELESDMLAGLLKDYGGLPIDTVKLVDADGDLVCDSPADADCKAPEKLVFTYVPTPEASDDPEAWADVVKALGEATGLPAEYRAFESTNDELAAMARGELHVAGVNTGAAPAAVANAGFVPVCTLGSADGTWGYTMKMIVPAKGGVDSLDKLKGKEVAFTRPDSNSGFKAALILLMTEHELLPERDYRWSFTYDHDASIKEVVAGEIDAAPVASDILARMTNDGEVSAVAYKVVYESEKFPPAVLGMAHNLPSELRTKVRDALLGFNWAGTSIEKKYGSSGAAKFVPVTYKDDWANIRRIDEAVAKAKRAGTTKK
ncbi:MAG: phosphate/phosphite/phosphonate ABC transporter substrate-binding protein [Lacipirellulaceae bacterium]